MAINLIEALVQNASIFMMSGFMLEFLAIYYLLYPSKSHNKNHKKGIALMVIGVFLQFIEEFISSFASYYIGGPTITGDPFQTFPYLLRAAAFAVIIWLLVRWAIQYPKK